MPKKEEETFVPNYDFASLYPNPPMNIDFDKIYEERAKKRDETIDDILEEDD